MLSLRLGFPSQGLGCPSWGLRYPPWSRMLSLTAGIPSSGLGIPSLRAGMPFPRSWIPSWRCPPWSWDLLLLLLQTGPSSSRFGIPFPGSGMLPSRSGAPSSGLGRPSGDLGCPPGYLNSKQERNPIQPWLAPGEHLKSSSGIRGTDEGPGVPSWDERFWGFFVRPFCLFFQAAFTEFSKGSEEWLRILFAAFSLSCGSDWLAFPKDQGCMQHPRLS